MELITKYFPNLSKEQSNQFEALGPLYREWNAKINVISRKDIDNLYLHHILHSLAIAEVTAFKPNTRILDFGTGGGFPGIPLAIFYPKCHFRLIDGTGKKITVASEIAKSLGLKNVEAIHRRGEEEKDKFDFIVSRGVMPMAEMVKLMQKNVSETNHHSMPNGFITLKGGDLNEELKPFRNRVAITPISSIFHEEWFKGKYIVYLPAK